MRRHSGLLVSALVGLGFLIGADSATTPGKKAFIVYSSDERMEIAPCG